MEKNHNMSKKAVRFALWAACGMALAASAEVIFEAPGPITDKTPGFRFGNVTFTDNDHVCAKFQSVEFGDGSNGRLTTNQLKIPGKSDRHGAYFKFSFDLRYAFVSGNGGESKRCNQGVFFYDRRGRVLPDCYDTLYPGAEMRHYERVLYAWDEVDSFEVFFQKPWAMSEKNGDRCTLEVANVKVETATWEDAAAYADSVYSRLPPIAWTPEGDWTGRLPRTMDALRTGKPWRVVMLGDSIVQDTFHSQFHALLKRAFPQSRAEWILSMRGGTGCWHYILAENFYRYVVDHRPDLLIVGGISNGRRHDETAHGRDVGPTGTDAMIRVAKLARERLGCEVLVVNEPLNVDLRPHAIPADDRPLPKMDYHPDWLSMVGGGRVDYFGLRNRCKGAGIQWWDAHVPCYRWLFSSGLPYMHYSRDVVHSGELGKQIIGRIMLGYFLSGEKGAE